MGNNSGLYFNNVNLFDIMYNRTQTNDALALKANQLNTYTKTETEVDSQRARVCQLRMGERREMACGRGEWG